MLDMRNSRTDPLFLIKSIQNTNKYNRPAGLLTCLTFIPNLVSLSPNFPRREFPKEQGRDRIVPANIRVEAGELQVCNGFECRHHS